MPALHYCRHSITGSHLKKAVVPPKACVHFIIKSYISQEEDIKSTLVVSNFAGRGKKLETAGVQIKNSALETRSYYRKSGHG